MARLAVPVKSWPRRQFGEISLAVPPGLFEDDEAPPGCLAAFTALAPATLRIRRIDPGAATSLSEILAGLTDASPHADQAGEHCIWPGLRAEPPGEPRQMHFLFESGGAAYHGLAEAPSDLWADYGAFLESVMRSLDIAGAPSPRLPLFAEQGAPAVAERPPEPGPVETARRRLADASGEARALILQHRFGDAETLLRSIDADIHGAAALAAAAEAALYASPSDALILTEAIRWARAAFPQPHTAHEAEDYSRAADEAEEVARYLPGVGFFGSFLIEGARRCSRPEVRGTCAFALLVRRIRPRG